MEGTLHSVLEHFPVSIRASDVRLSALSISRVALVLVTLWLLGFLTFVTYNLFFHPLAKYPGPRLACCTSLVYWFHFIYGDSIPWIDAAHKRHGAVVRLAPDRLSYTSPAAWKDIFGHRTAGHAANPKDMRYLAGEVNGHHSMLTEPDDERHGRMRRIFSHAFSDRALGEQEPLIQGYVAQLVALMRRALDAGGGVEGKGVELDATQLFNFTTFDIMGDLTFGEPLGNLAHSRYAPWVNAVFACFKGFQITRALNEYRVAQLVWFLVLMPRRIKDAATLTVGECAERVDKRMRKGYEGQKPDIWGLVMRAEGEGFRYPHEEMVSQSFLFMVAGTETTATLLSGLTWLLLTSPARYKRLVEEVRAVAREEDLGSDKNLRKLKYMNACLEEALRVYPPVPMGTMREVAKGGNFILGDWLPERTRITVAHWSAYRSPENWKDPDAFLPERWIAGEPGYETHYAYDKREAHQPFSYGPRNCLGKNLAYYEMRAILARVIWNFDFELCPGMENWMKQDTWFLWEKPPLMVRVTSRV